jgi:hypothetical protein
MKFGRGISSLIFIAMPFVVDGFMNMCSAFEGNT